VVISNLFIRHKTPQPQFAPGAFLGLIALFVVMGVAKPLIALVGLGTTAVIAAVLVEVNRVRIWETYRKSYRKQKGLKGVFTQPSQTYYMINVVVLWPVILLLGVMCLYAAYILG
jgi:hypothetical protein